METLNDLPPELYWNVIKYMVHPLATIIKNKVCSDCFRTNFEAECNLCNNMFCTECFDSDEFSDNEGNVVICIDCLVDRHEDCLWMDMRHKNKGSWKTGLYHVVAHDIEKAFDILHYKLKRHNYYMDTLNDEDNKKLIKRELGELGYQFRKE